MEKHNGIYHIFKHNQKMAIRIFNDVVILNIIKGIAEKYKNDITFINRPNTKDKKLLYLTITLYFNKPITEEIKTDLQKYKIVEIVDFLTFKYEYLELI